MGVHSNMVRASAAGPGMLVEGEKACRVAVCSVGEDNQAVVDVAHLNEKAAGAVTVTIAVSWQR